MDARPALGAAAAALALALSAAPGAADAPQWGAPVVVAHVPLDGAWFYEAFAAADFNADGHEDALLVRDSQTAQQTFPVTVLLGDGTGRFTDGTTGVFSGTPAHDQFARQLVVAELNGDGRPDVFIADTGDDHDPWPGYQNTLILSAPGGRLVDATANLPQVSDYSHSAAAADVNGDGATDIYVGNIYGANRVPPRILLNDGSGHFSAGAGLLPAELDNVDSTKYDGCAFVDVNGDNRPDLVLAGDQVVTTSAVLLNDGTGHFSFLPDAMPAKPFGADAIGLGPSELDVNGDSHADILIGYTKSNPSYVGRWIQVLVGNGDGSFRDETAMRLPQTDNSLAWPKFFLPRDLDHDGREDVGVQVFGPSAQDSALTYLVDSAGSFHASAPVPGVHFTPWSFIDSRGDGSNDVIAVSDGADVVLIPETHGAATPPPPQDQPQQPQQPAASDTVAPVLRRLRLAPAAFRAARSGPAIARTRAGASVRYELSEAASSRFTVDRAARGLKRGRRCGRLPRRHTRPKRRPCTRFVPVPGSLSHLDAPGPNRFRFRGRIGHRTLAPGTYRLDATPTDAAANVGPTAHALFRVAG
jgi:hypothetical protein